MSLNSAPLISVFEDTELVDRNISSLQESVYQPEVAPRANNGQDVDYTIITRSASVDEFLLPARAYLQVEYNLVTSDSDVTTAVTAAAGMLNGWSLFKTVSLEINGSEIEQCDNPSQVSHIMSLLKKSKANIEQYGDESSYYPPTDSDDTTGTVTAGTDAQRDRAVSRLGAYSGSYHTTAGWLKLPLKDVLGFCNLDKAYRGAQFRFRFALQNDMTKILVIATNSTVGFVRIKSVALVIPSLRPSLGLLDEINSKLISGAEIPVQFERVYYRSYTDSSSGTHTVDIPVATACKRPKMIIAAVQKASRATRASTAAVSYLYYDAETITQHSVQINGKQFPAREFQGNNYGYIREWNAFQSAAAKNLDNESSSFPDYTDFKQKFPVLVYDCENAGEIDMGAVSNSFAQVQHRLTYNPAAANSVIHYLIVGTENRTLKEEGGALLLSAPK